VSHDALTTLRIPALQLFVISRFASGAAMTMLYSSIAWQVYELSGSAFWLGMLGLVRFVPHASLSLVGGALADSRDRRLIVLSSQIVPFLCAGALWYWTSSGTIDLARILGVMAAIGVAVAFESPARIALLPGLVPRALFPRAVTISTSGSALAFVSGPALGGLVIAEYGVAATYALHSGLIAVSVVALAFLRPRSEVAERRAFSWQSILEGVSFVRRRQVVLGSMILDMFAVIFGGAQALLPVYAREILDVGPRGYGLLTASLELGALLMALVLIVMPPIRRAGRALLWAVAAYGVATILFGVSRSFPLSVLAYMAVGMADQVSVVTRHTLVQLATPDELRGRVSSVNMVFIGASNQLGAVEAGFVAALTSATFAVVSGGLACLVVLGVVAVRMPELRRHRIDAAPPTPR
jgi:MFS family permease